MDKISEYMQKDWVLKLLALCIAVFLWFYAESEQNPVISKTFDIPVEMINLAEDYVVSDGAKTVRLNVRGKSTDLTSMRGDDFVAVIDLSDAQPGQATYDVRVDVPSTVERYTISPNSLTLTIDQLTEAKVKVRVVTSGTPATGYRFDSAEVIPEYAEIYGRNSVIETLDYLETESVDISGMSGDTVLETKLKVPSGIQVSSGTSVVARVHIVEEQGTGSYMAPIELQNIPNEYEVSMTRDSALILLRGSQLLLNEQTEREKMHLYVDCGSVVEGENTLPIQLRYEGNLEVLQIDPGTVSVTATRILTDENGGDDSASEISVEEGDAENKEESQ